MSENTVIIKAYSLQIIGAVTRFSEDMAEVPDSHSFHFGTAESTALIVFYGTTREKLTASVNGQRFIIPALDTYFEWEFMPVGTPIPVGI